MREGKIQDAIRLELGNPSKYPELTIWRNNVGVLQDRDGRFVRYGLAPGSADLIGIFAGRFIAAEIKTPQGKESDEQARFGRLVEEKGGAYAVLRSVEDAVKWIEKLRKST